MKTKILVLFWGLLFICSCRSRVAQDAVVAEPTPSQQKLLDAGWTVEVPDEDMTEEFGIKPIYGIQDNYFDIAIGSGCNVAVKIVNVQNDQCIRYVYVAENSTTTVQEIPQGVYYLKLAYGYDWMELETDSTKIGKFTRNVSYEKSQDTFDFGIKNSREERNYRLEINVINSQLENNFLSTPISEEEFLK